MKIWSIGTISTTYNKGLDCYIFNNILDRTDIQEIQEYSDSFFTVNNIGEDSQINLYITDNQLYTLAVVKSCIKFKCKLNCLHYISNLGCYIAQPML